MQYPKYSLGEVLQLYLCALADYSVNVKKYQQYYGIKLQIYPSIKNNKLNQSTIRHHIYHHSKVA